MYLNGLCLSGMVFDSPPRLPTGLVFSLLVAFEPVDADSKTLLFNYIIKIRLTFDLKLS